MEITEKEGAVLGLMWWQRGLCGLVILCREGWWRGSSEITLAFFVMYLF